MPYCPECRRQFEDDVDVCPHDNAELVEELPYQTIESDDGTVWIEIASVGTDDEARLLQGFLEAEEIPAQIESLKFTMEPVNFGQLGDIRVYVPSQFEQTAFDLIRERELEYVNLRDDQISTDDGPARIEDDSETEEPSQPE
jgi:hypothetical protein